MGHYGCNSNGEHERCNSDSCGWYDQCKHKNMTWFDDVEPIEEKSIGEQALETIDTIEGKLKQLRKLWEG